MKSPPIVEIMGPWLPNNGDGLNLWAVANRLSPSATLAVSSTLGLERLPERPHLCRVAWPPDWRAVRGAASRSPRALVRICRHAAALTCAPRSMLRARGVAPGRDISALVDCSGFAYGDGWSTRRVDVRERYYARLKRQGSRLVMLPQAFGPFSQPAVRARCRRLLAHCDLIYARDAESLRHLEDLGLGETIGGVAPDITHLLPGTPPDDREAWRRRVCLVPNTRMVDRTPLATGGWYQSFLLHAIRLVRERRLEPWLVIHERYDAPLAHEIGQAAEGRVPIVSQDALASKGILGACHAVIGSRYHALVSALSQGVPAIGTSWSHKYGELFDDYGCAECLLSSGSGRDEVAAVVGRLLDVPFRDGLAARLAERAEAQKAEVERMWSRAEPLIAAGRRHHERERPPCRTGSSVA